MELTPEQIVALVIGGWILIAVLGEPLHEVIRKLSHVIGGLLKSIIDGLARTIPAIGLVSGTLQHYVRRFWDGVQPLLDQIVAALAVSNSALHGHSREALELLPTGSKPRWLHAFGYLLYLIAFLGFGYADVAQAANSRSVMYVGLEVPSFFQDLTVPLLIASAGTAIVLGTIMGDLLARTDFVPWCTLPRWARGIIGAIVLVTFLFDVILMLLIALVRVTEIIPTLIPESLAEQLRTLAAFADSLVIIPLLVTTFLLFWGLFGLLVLYVIFINVLILTSRLFGFALGLLRSASPWLAKGSAAVVAIIFALISSALAFLKWAFETLGVVLERLFELFEAILDLIIFPLVQPARGVKRYFRE